jgi:hypothetical protein
MLPRAITISSVFFLVQNSALLALPLSGGAVSSSALTDALTIVADSSNDILILIGPTFPLPLPVLLLPISASSHQFVS